MQSALEQLPLVHSVSVARSAWPVATAGGQWGSRWSVTFLNDLLGHGRTTRSAFAWPSATGASAQSVQQAIRAYLPGAGTVSVSRAEPDLLGQTSWRVTFLSLVGDAPLLVGGGAPDPSQGETNHGVTGTNATWTVREVTKGQGPQFVRSSA